ncbi:hypothetical protein P9E76_11545 [Schinkia azotoformans]|uniref:SHOCT domain-containing protein n=1 Tax=Schinkia azotoformans LMG 9581 TaxID=1131731 RepID=K6DKH9_SCHAZ|nr:hypothetical protein [Schinkia azotoformans]EKN68643.1 hypothetical protein BAZO_03260 [Schinkia azotoformans LMG 9581]MEC1640712.1 hypothetical protein [Schinkia azotoformans]MEC1945678.1 hypothetical protein [Schinkia azotoformans]
MKHFLHNGLLIVIAFTFSFIWFMSPDEPKAEMNQFKFEELTIVLMPEYNLHPDEDITDPNLLIGFHGKIMNQSKDEIKSVTVRVPAKEKNFVVSLAAVQTSDTEETVKEIKYKLNEDEESITLQFPEAVQPGATLKFMLEYFYTPIKVTNEQKEFSYSYSAIADADLMNLMLFEPLGTESLTATPASQKQATDTMGVKMHLYEYKNVKTGDEKQYSFSYVKVDDVTTVEKVEQITSEHSELTEALNEEQIQAKSETTAKGVFNAELIVGIALILIIAILFVVMFMKKRKQRNTKVNNPSIADKKELRKLLAEGKIGEKEYMEKLSKTK